jgi:hypothetical protein
LTHRLPGNAVTFSLPLFRQASLVADPMARACRCPPEEEPDAPREAAQKVVAPPVAEAAAGPHALEEVAAVAETAPLVGAEVEAAAAPHAPEGVAAVVETAPLVGAAEALPKDAHYPQAAGRARDRPHHDHQARDRSAAGLGWEPAVAVAEAQTMALGLAAAAARCRVRVHSDVPARCRLRGHVDRPRRGGGCPALSAGRQERSTAAAILPAARHSADRMPAAADLPARRQARSAARASHSARRAAGDRRAGHFHRLPAPAAVRSASPV